MPRKSTRNAKGGGTIRKKTVTRSGKEYTYWEARITTGRDPGTGKQIQRSFTGKTQKEVREKMQAAAVEVNQGTYTTPQKMTVGQWLDIWQRDYLGAVKPSTVRNYRNSITNYIKPALGAVRLQELHPHPSPSKPHGQAAALAAAPVKAAVRGVHHELAEYEDDNVGVKSVHGLEESVETGGSIMRHSSRSQKLKHFRQAEKAEKRLGKANVNLLYQKSLRDNPQSARNPLSRWQQKQQIKKQYAARLRELQRTGSTADWIKSVGDGAKRTAAGIEKAAGFVKQHKKGVAIIMALFVSLTVMLNLMSSCTAMLESGLSIFGGST